MADLEIALRIHVNVALTTIDLLPAVHDVGSALCEAFSAGHRVYTFGNGGSAAEAQHLVAELIGRYRGTRRALPAQSLASDPSVVTCIGNDFDFDQVFARQISALVDPGDVAIAFTTSGRSPNVVNGLAVARRRGAVTVLFGAGDGADAAAHADLSLLVASDDTARAQEMHLLLLHLVSAVVDDWAEQGESDTSMDDEPGGRIYPAIEGPDPSPRSTRGPPAVPSPPRDRRRAASRPDAMKG
ncbi:MAG: SIS domain-containing protein [Candidatus Limnocylindrales bacterium]